MSLGNLLEHCQNVSFIFNKEQADVVEGATKAQSDSRLWFRYRAGHITASNTSDLAISVVRAMCYPEVTKFSNAATRRVRV